MLGSLSKKISITVALLLGSLGLSAQDNFVDSVLALPTDSLHSIGRISGSPVINSPNFKPQNYNFTPNLGLPEIKDFEVSLPPITPGVANIFSWKSGGISAFGSSESYPGLMGIESGGLAMMQSFGKFDLMLDATATKYGYFRGLTKIYSFNGSLTYNINDRLRFTLQGTYVPNGQFNQPAMFEAMDNTSISGLFDYQFNDHWGMLFGTQTYYSYRSRHWDIRPVAMPYYLVGGAVPIGIDVGGIVFEIVRSAIESKSSYGNFQNPTIGPPIPTGPYPIRPKNW